MAPRDFNLGKNISGYVKTRYVLHYVAAMKTNHTVDSSKMSTPNLQCMQINNSSCHYRRFTYGHAATVHFNGKMYPFYVQRSLYHLHALTTLTLDVSADIAPLSHYNRFDIRIRLILRYKTKNPLCLASTCDIYHKILIFLLFKWNLFAAIPVVSY